MRHAQCDMLGNATHSLSRREMSDPPRSSEKGRASSISCPALAIMFYAPVACCIAKDAGPLAHILLGGRLHAPRTPARAIYHTALTQQLCERKPDPGSSHSCPLIALHCVRPCCESTSTRDMDVATCAHGLRHPKTVLTRDNQVLRSMV